MRLVIQRSLDSYVKVDNHVIGKIDKGLVILVGVTHDDTMEDVNYLAKKVANLRIFEDEEGKTNLSIQEVQGQILSISQFTLMANTRKGNRPSFVRAAEPNYANDLYEAFNDQLRAMDFVVETGQFGADMKVVINNNGPMTIVMDSKQKEF